MYSLPRRPARHMLRSELANGSFMIPGCLIMVCMGVINLHFLVSLCVIMNKINAMLQSSGVEKDLGGALLVNNNLKCDHK